MSEEDRQTTGARHPDWLARDAELASAVAGVTWSTLPGKPTFSSVSFSGSYSDLTNTPSIPTSVNTLVGTVTIAESNISVSLGVRRVTVALAGTVTGGNYVAFAVSALTAGYSIQDCICTTNGQITVGLLVPVLVVGSYSFSLRIVRLNT